MKKIIIILLILPCFVFGQENNTIQKPSFKLGIVPQYAISNGTRIDLDFQLNNPKHWLVFAPQLYISNRDNLGWNYNSMFGAGIEVQHKIFLNEKKSNRGVYVAYGPVFNYFNVKDDGFVASNFIDNGGNYIDLQEDEIATGIFKFGANLIFGIEFTISERFYFDPYIGTGIRLSVDNRTTGLHGYYNDWWGDLGYSGTLMVGGARFGVNF